MKILVIEDEPIIAVHYASILTEAGMQVLGPTDTADWARRVLDQETPDGVLLDINLHGTQAFGLAEEIRSRNVPIIIVSGQRKCDLAPNLQHIYFVAKPVTARRLIEVVRMNFDPEFEDEEEAC